MVNTSEVVTMVQDFLGEDSNVTLHQVDKGNGVLLDAVVIKAKGSNVAPTIYFDESANDTKAEAIRIKDLYEQYKVTGDIDMEFYTDYEQVKSRLGIKLSSNPAKGIAKKVAFCDLYITAYVNVSSDNFGDGVINVKEEQIRKC